MFDYTWGHGNSGVPLDLFHRTSKLEWALIDNLTPLDATSVQKAIDHTQAALAAPLPCFDLCIRYFGMSNEEGASRDLAKIQYRHARRNNVHDLRPGPIEPVKLGNLDCVYDRQHVKELHRLSSIYRQNAALPWVGSAALEGRRRKLAEDYAKAFL